MISSGFRGFRGEAFGCVSHFFGLFLNGRNILAVRMFFSIQSVDYYPSQRGLRQELCGGQCSGSDLGTTKEGSMAQEGDNCCFLLVICLFLRPFWSHFFGFKTLFVFMFWL